MSNFLSHLVGRSLGEGDRVKPRLPSLFEPLPETTTLGVVLPNEVSEPEVSIAPEPMETHPAINSSSDVQPASQTQTSHLSPAPLFPSPKTAVPGSVFPSVQPQQIQDLPQWDAPFQTVITPTSPLAKLPARPASEPLAQDRLEHFPATPISAEFVSHPVQSVSGQEAATIREIVILSEVRMARSPEEADSTISPAQSTVISTASSVPVEPMPVLRPAIAATVPNTSLFPSIRSQPDQIAPPPPPPAPTIHVSIGRIEVKASLSAPQSAKPRTAPTVMNLDEYLRQRGGGR